jgi:hypothetical protein
MMHDNISGMLVNHKKEYLLQEIETQIDKGGDGLAEQDAWKFRSIRRLVGRERGLLAISD